MSEHNLKNCPACGDSRMSLQHFDLWHWVTCGTCHYCGPRVLGAASAIIEYNDQRNILATYLIPRSEALLTTADAARDAHAAKIADIPTPLLLAELCKRDPEACSDAVADQLAAASMNAWAERDAALARAVSAETALTAMTAERDEAIADAHRLFT